MKQSTEEHSKKSTKLSPLSIALSTIAAAFGVQSQKNLERDFSETSPAAFIVGGIVFTVCFVGALYLIVMLILNSAGV